MPVVVIQEFEATREEYEAVDAKIGDAPPDGGFFTPDSTWGETDGSWSTSGSRRSLPEASCRTS